MFEFCSSQLQLFHIGSYSHVCKHIDLFTEIRVYESIVYTFWSVLISDYEYKLR